MFSTPTASVSLTYLLPKRKSIPPNSLGSWPASSTLPHSTEDPQGKREFPAQCHHHEGKHPHLPLPPFFSPNLWETVIHNSYMDFDKVYDSNYTSHVIEHETEISSSSICLILLDQANSSSSQKICSPGEWSIMWHKYKQAILFVYPHRSEELDIYETYLIGLFGAYRGHLHPSIISLMSLNPKISSSAIPQSSATSRPCTST
jgi:hypothetical protein